MFRLVKRLNGNTHCENVKLRVGTPFDIRFGDALSCVNGVIAPPAVSSSPDYISMLDLQKASSSYIDCMVVTEDMVFLVEYQGATPPVMGMTVAIANSGNKRDRVSFNANGKGTIIGISDNKELVYVVFRK